ncbi:Wilms tumor protein 1-interacting protein [Fasciola gigantica]|uniref:Wilms tumor protein 1-interacting protein n=1 Tax=Fasciola gigantica TaxID=46835 RepID=A0A504YTW2_FASGI|nr:Wilms tumor protein 1-interacting protein [Fasciola gigantica]
MYGGFMAPTAYQPRVGPDKLLPNCSSTPTITVHNSEKSASSATSKSISPTKNDALQKLPSLTIDSAQLDIPSVMDNTQAPPISPGMGSRSLGPCAECGLRIINLADACHALGYLYHNSCFVCCYCQRSLRGKIFYKDQDKIYCEEDYLYCGFQQTTEKCSVCGHLISETILQAMGNSYHPGCFRCCVCTKCLDGVPFTVDANKLIYCLPDYHLVHAPRCGACGLVIIPEEGSDEIVRVVALDKEFHLSCYCCSDCKRKLGDEPENRCYPMTDSDLQSPDRLVQRLLCLNCHLSRIGAVPATAANVTTTTGAKPLSGQNSQSGGSLLRFYPLSSKTHKSSG